MEDETAAKGTVNEFVATTAAAATLSMGDDDDDDDDDDASLMPGAGVSAEERSCRSVDIAATEAVAVAATKVGVDEVLAAMGVDTEGDSGLRCGCERSATEGDACGAAESVGGTDNTRGSGGSSD